MSALIHSFRTSSRGAQIFRAATVRERPARTGSRARACRSLTVAALTACGGQLADRQVDAVGNVLVYSASAQGAYSGTDNAGFTPTTTQAWVTWEGTQVGAGSVGVQVFDGAGAVLYGQSAKRDEVPSGQATSVGKAGSWRLSVKFDKASGFVKVKVEGSTGGTP